MKTIKVLGKILRNGDYSLKSAGEEVEERNLEVDTPNFLVNLLTLRKNLRESVTHGFEYVFPMAFDPILETNGFKATFPLIFE